MKTNEYTAQAEKFLMDTGTTLSVVEAVPQKKPLWAKGLNGINYSVTLKNAKGQYVFDFWGSIRDREMLEHAKEVDALQSKETPLYFKVMDFIKENGEKAENIPIRFRTVEVVKRLIQPTCCDILACMDILHEESFDDFCSSFGYDTDSITALKTYEAVKEQDRQLRRLFTYDELQALSEIQ